MVGIIIKAYGGFYFVQTGDRILKCVIRGKIRRRHGQVLVGDRVRVNPAGEGEGVVEDILPRASELVRPPVANVDQAVIVFSINDPRPNTMLLDRFLLQARAAGIEPVICFNKIDLAAAGELDILRHYEPTGYPLLRVSAQKGTNIDDLRELLKERISVLAGPSGVGKSSLLNALQPGLELKTGEISRKLKRGRHTTRHVELIPLAAGGLVADTPGFSSMYLPPVRREELPGYYPEFDDYAPRCRFTGCLHYREPGCAVKEAVEDGRISLLRYEHYLELLEEVMEAERRH
jgi:ribosome biogenesis GTPase